MNRIKPWILACAILLMSPIGAVAVNCWNDCTELATDWMHDNNATYEQASIYFDGCLAGCGGGPPPGPPN